MVLSACCIVTGFWSTYIELCARMVRPILQGKPLLQPKRQPSLRQIPCIPGVSFGVFWSHHSNPGKIPAFLDYDLEGTAASSSPCVLASPQQAHCYSRHGVLHKVLQNLSGNCLCVCHVSLLRMQVDKLAETKGLDYLDREKAKRQAGEQAQQMYDQQYGQYY